MHSELYALQNTLREHVHAFAVDIGPRTLFNLSSLARAANYIRSVLECAGLSVSEQNYEYYGQQVTNVLATIPSTVGASAYYVVGAHYDTVPETPGADDNASAVAVMLELATRLRQKNLKVPVVFAASRWKNRRHSRPIIRAAASSSKRPKTMVTVLSEPSFWRWLATPLLASAIQLFRVGLAIQHMETSSVSLETGARARLVARL